MTISKPALVGLTGGIGSGKTTVSKYFTAFGIPVYYADTEAKTLMLTSETIRKNIIALFGKAAYLEGQLNTPFLRQQIFNNTNLLQAMNAVVHPEVAQHFSNWLEQQKTSYVIKEAAIIFEHNLQEQYDYIITVVADKEQRIQRVMQRDNTTRAEVISILKQQLPDAEKVKQSDFVIQNNSIDTLQKQVEKIHNYLILR